MARFLVRGACVFAVFLVMTFSFSGIHKVYGMERQGKVGSEGGEQALLEKSRAMGTMRIIVKIRLDTGSNEARKNDKEKARAISEVQARLLTDLASRGFKPMAAYKYKFVPLMAMTVDTAILTALLSLPDVVSVEEDLPDRPAASSR